LIELIDLNEITCCVAFTGTSNFRDGGLAANNPSKYGLDEARSLWRNSSIDCLISVGTGFSTNTPSKGDGRVVWGRRVVNLIQETIKMDQLTKDECDRSSIFYRRLNPQLNDTISFDCTDTTYFERLAQLTTNYLKQEVIKEACCQLLANLLYVDRVTTEPLQLIIRSRVVPFCVSKQLGEWRLICECTTNSSVRTEVVRHSRGESFATIFINRYFSRSRFLIALKFNDGKIYSISGGKSFVI
jgi:hypothetical protein